MPENGQLAFAKVVEVFDKHAAELMDLSIPMNNKMVMWELNNLLSLGEAFDNPNALSLMADKLPSMLVAFGLELIQKEEDQTALGEEIELLIQEKWQPTLEYLIKKVDELKDLEGKKIANAIKSAPTQAGIRATIILNNKAMLDDLNARKARTDKWVKQLSLICKAIELRGKLLNSQLNMSNTMVRSGVG